MYIYIIYLCMYNSRIIEMLHAMYQSMAGRYVYFIYIIYIFNLYTIVDFNLYHQYEQVHRTVCTTQN